MSEKFSTKERKKEFDQIYKLKILPYLESEGFHQVTRTSKRVFKEFQNGLSVYIYFEFISFGSGFYTINIVYFDDTLGKESEDGLYLATGKIKKPTMKGKNAAELNESAELWLKEMKTEIVPFIHQHSNHDALCKSNEIEITRGVEHVFQQKCSN